MNLVYSSDPAVFVTKLVIDLALLYSVAVFLRAFYRAVRELRDDWWTQRVAARHSGAHSAQGSCLGPIHAGVLVDGEREGWA